MNLKNKRSSSFQAEVYTSSLNDIMFFLLLFFLIVSTLVNPSVIKLLLPKASASTTVSKMQITLSVDKNKLYYLNNVQIPFENLETEIKKVTANIPGPTIILRFDSSLSVQDLVNVLQIGTKMQIKMVLATKHVNS
jgi:biopolymer transport protein ExbD